MHNRPKSSIHIDVHHHNEGSSGGDDVSWKLDQILSLLTFLAQEVINMSAELDALEAQVEKNTSTEDSAILLIKGIAAQLAAAATDPARVRALETSLRNSADALAAAVVANTDSDGDGVLDGDEEDETPPFVP